MDLTFEVIFKSVSSKARALILKSMGVGPLKCELEELFANSPDNRVLFLGALAQLNLFEKGLTRTSPLLHSCRSLTSLLLNDNEIVAIENLEQCVNLRRLYLQNNCISEIAGLENLKKLECLNLANNRISELQGLESCDSLNTLDLGNQRIEKTLTVSSVPPNLKELNMPNCRAVDLTPIAAIKKLEVLNVQDNLLDQFGHISKVLESCKRLRVLKVKGNPLAELRLLRDDRFSLRQRAILISSSLASIDEKDVQFNEREFLLQFVKVRKSIQSSKS